MEKNKYIEVIDHFEDLYTKEAIDSETAWWATQAVILCTMKDDIITDDEYYCICEYRDRLFE